MGILFLTYFPHEFSAFPRIADVAFKRDPGAQSGLLYNVQTESDCTAKLRHLLIGK